MANLSFLAPLVAALAILVGLAVQVAKGQEDEHEPIKLPIEQGQPWVPCAFTPAYYSVQGNIGEMLTSIILAQWGWRQLPSKGSGPQGIDGLFILEPRDRGIERMFSGDPQDEDGFLVLVTETKTNTATLADGQMTDKWVRDNLDKLAAAGVLKSETIATMIKALDNGDPALRKELWHHDLIAGVTTMTELDADGKPKEDHTIRLEEMGRRMEALTMTLDNLDTNNRYLPDCKFGPH